MGMPDFVVCSCGVLGLLFVSYSLYNAGFTDLCVWLSRVAYNTYVFPGYEAKKETLNNIAALNKTKQSLNGCVTTTSKEIN